MKEKRLRGSKIISALLAIIMCIGLIPTVSFAETEEKYSTVSKPEDYKAENTYLDTTDNVSLFSEDKKVLLVEDVNPWSSTANQEVLSEITQFKKVTTAEFLQEDLSEYGVIVFANDQPFDSYENYKSFKEYMEKFASIGGVIVFGACDDGWAKGNLTEALPGNVKKKSKFAVKNVIADFTHPIVTTSLTENIPLTNGDLVGSYCSHIYFDENTLPPGSKIIMRESETNNPTLVEYPLGKGRVIASGLTWEFTYDRPGRQGSYGPIGYFAKKALDDMYRYAIRVSSIDVDDVHILEEYHTLHNSHHIIVSDSSFNAIKGANVTINNQTFVTGDDGMVIYTGPFGKYEVKVSADGYKDCVHCYNIQPKTSKNIILEKDEDAAKKPYIVSVCDSETGRDLRYQARKFEENSGEMIEINITADWGSYSAGEYIIYQEGDIDGAAGNIIKTSDGKFRFAPGKVFMRDKTIKAKLISNEGTESEPVDLKLAVYTKDKYEDDKNNNVDKDDNNDNNDNGNGDNGGIDVSVSVSQYMADNYVLLSATVSNKSAKAANTAISIIEDTIDGIVLDMKNIGEITNESNYIYVYRIDKNYINFNGRDYKNYYITADTLEEDTDLSNNTAAITIYPEDLTETDPDNVEEIEIIPVTGITTQDEIVLEIGDEGIVTYQLTADVMPENATNKAVKWFSDNKNITVDESGLISAYTEGSAYITAVTYDGEFTSTTKVTVISDKNTTYVVPDGKEEISDGELDEYNNITVIYIPKSVTVINDGAFEDFKRLKDVYYGGMEEDWEKIQIGERNDPLINANIHYTLSEPVIEAEDIEGGKMVKISAVKNADIYYTTDGTDPSVNSKKYENSFIIDTEETVTVKAIAVKSEYTDSAVSEKTISVVKASMPTSSVPSGEVRGRTGIELIADGTIYYSINNGEEKVYTESLKIAEDTTIKAYTVKVGCANSDIAEFVYTVKQIPELNDGDHGTSGGCSWSFEGDTLYIYGKGNMASYNDGEAPWYGGKYQIKHIIIEEGINNIGSYAFSGLEVVEDIKIPSTIDTIENNAMNDCHSLKELNLSPEMKSGIGINAFRNCTSLTNVVLPDGVTIISSGAFEGCAALTDITLPFIGSAVGSENNKNTFSYIFNGIVPESLKNVTITHETNVPEKAFENCANIETISINPEIETIGAGAFDGCGSLKGFVIPEGIAAIDDYTFRNCKSAVEIAVPNTVLGIGMAAFDGCRALQSINIPAGINEIKDYTFRNCASLTQIDIPDSVENIGADVLAGCNKLYTVKIPFVGANVDPGFDGITHNGVFGYLFGEGKGVLQGEKEYAIPPSITKVEVSNPDKDNYIPTGAFINCANIRDIIVNGGNDVFDKAFANCRNLKNIYLPRSVSFIGDEILENCVSLETMTVPFIGKSRSDKNLETSVLGAFFGKGTTTVQKGDIEQEYNNGQSDKYNIPESLKNVIVLNQTDIPYGAFMNCDNIEYVSIVSGAVIYDKAFYNCASLKQVSLPKNMREIGYEAFAECESLEYVNIPVNAKSIGDYAFYNAINLKEIVIPKAVEAIADNVFAGTPFVLNSEDTAQLTDAATDAVIVCAEGSYAQQYAEENNIRYRLADESALNIKNTSTVINKHSDRVYYFDITDTNNLRGKLFVVLYDENGNMLKTRMINANNNEYRTEFTEDEIQNADYAKIFIWNDLSKMSPMTNKAEIKSFR